MGSQLSGPSENQEGNKKMCKKEAALKTALSRPKNESRELEIRPSEKQVLLRDGWTGQRPARRPRAAHSPSSSQGRGRGPWQLVTGHAFSTVHEVRCWAAHGQGYYLSALQLPLCPTSPTLPGAIAGSGHSGNLSREKFSWAACPHLTATASCPDTGTASRKSPAHLLAPSGQTQRHEVPGSYCHRSVSPGA